MKNITFILVLFYSLGVSAQTWQTIPSEHYNIYKFSSGTATVSNNYSQFEINPYDGSMWFISNQYDSNFNIKRIQTDGTLTLFTPANMPFMDMNSRYFYGIDFSSGKTFVMHGFDGAFSFDGSTWSHEANFGQGSYVSSDADTLYFGRVNQDLVRLTETGTTYNWPYCRRLTVKNGNAWSTNSFYTSIHKLNSTLDLALPYSSDTSNLLDNTNNDFKFARNSDTLYVAGEQGFSLAFGETFVDTITMNNAPNMPYPSILEFEFDSQDNIWAVFGDGSFQGFFLPTYIGYYDRSAQDWTLIYDQSNCPVNFSQHLDIEIDQNDNLWVCDNFDLHVLKINTTPTWLSLVEESTEQFSVFPNPSSGVISIQTEQSVSDIEIRDLSGRLIKSMKYSSEIEIKEKGTYLIRLLDHGKVIGNQKVIIE